MSTTPRTDAFEIKAAHDAIEYGKTWQPMVFARELKAELACEKENRNHLIEKGAKLETELAAAKECVAIANRSADDQMHQKREAQTELARLRAELKELSQAYELNRVSIDELDADRARAEKAEAALAEWSVLNLWGGTPEIIHKFIKGQQNRIHHCQDLEAECLEQARLLGMSGEREADLLGKIERLHSINENILVFAFRYALGRKTTAPGIVADVLIERWNDLKPHTQIQVQREIGSAMAMGEAGGSLDLDTWQAVLALPVKP